MKYQIIVNYNDGKGYVKYGRVDYVSFIGFDLVNLVQQDMLKYPETYKNINYYIAEAE